MRNQLLRNALALGVALAGLTSFSRDAQAFHAVEGKLWHRRAMTNGDGGCRVPYTEHFATNQVRDTFNQVVNYINTVTTCRWEPKQWWDVDYVDVTENGLDWDWWADYVSNAGGIGRNGDGRQEMRICHGCNTFNHILHEMGHSLGLFHEHQHPDRDTYLQIFREYIRSSSQGAFDKITEGNTTLGLPYERWSVMHYDGIDFMDPASATWCWFSGCRTMKFWSGGEPGPTEQFTGLELQGLKRRYPIPQRLTAMHSGRCIDIPASNSVPETIVQQFDCHEGTNQGWLLRWKEKVGNTDYYLVETADPNGVTNSPGQKGLCLDVQWGSQSAGAPVFLWECNGDHAQQWALEGAVNNTTGYRLRARHSNQCLEVSSNNPSNGAQIVQSTCAGTENQTWGLNFVPAALPPDVPCAPGERRSCAYDVDARRVICECWP